MPRKEHRTASPVSRRKDPALLSFGLGVLAGLGGALLGSWINHRRTAGQKPSGDSPAIQQLPAWQAALSERYEPQHAAELAACVKLRFADLYASRPRSNNAALRNHLEGNILPGLALYQVLKAEIEDDEALHAEIDRLFDASLRTSRLWRQASLLSKIPFTFEIFRLYNRLVIPRIYPAESWAWRWVENSPQLVAYDALDCFYLRTLTAYGAPELTPHFCRIDDQMFENFSFIRWGRTTTLARGGACCDFRFHNPQYHP